MIREYWDKLNAKVDSLSLRERALIFAAIAFIVISLINTLFLDPLWARQKLLSSQVVQQKEKMKSIQAQIEAVLRSRRNDTNSPLVQRISQIEQQLREGVNYIKGRSDRLVPSDKMANVLEQILNKNGHLQLVDLKTLPVAPLVEKNTNKQDTVDTGGTTEVATKQVFKHGVQITVRGSYPDMLRYLQALEHLRAQMFWGRAQLSVNQYPVAELTLTVYTLSLDKTWLVV